MFDRNLSTFHFQIFGKGFAIFLGTIGLHYALTFVEIMTNMSSVAIK